MLDAIMIRLISFVFVAYLQVMSGMSCGMLCLMMCELMCELMCDFMCNLMCDLMCARNELGRNE